MWSFVRRKISEQATSEKETPQVAEDGRQWSWISYAPQFCLILATVVGPRTYQTALILIQMTAMIVTGISCIFSDRYSCYLHALIEHYHKIKTFIRTVKRGHPKNPLKGPHPDLVYGQVVKERRNGRIVKVTHRVKCGAERLAQLGIKISTTLIERLNLTFRQSLAPLVRKTLSFSKERDNPEKQTVLFQTFYNFARPHMSLREKFITQLSLLNKYGNRKLQEWLLD